MAAKDNTAQRVETFEALSRLIKKERTQDQVTAGGLEQLSHLIQHKRSRNQKLMEAEKYKLAMAVRRYLAVKNQIPPEKNSEEGRTESLADSSESLVDLLLDDLGLDANSQELPHKS